MNPQLRRLALDFGPLAVLSATYWLSGKNIFLATGTFMVASAIALFLGWMIERKLSPMPIFTTVVVMIFGGLTLYLKNETYLKMKVTVIYFCFGLLLLGGLATRRLFIKYVFSQAFDLTEEGWRKLTLRWGAFCFALAALNEVVWRNVSTGIWLNFKVFGIIPLIFLFTMTQVPLILRHGQDVPSEDGPPEDRLSKD
jgi:intracellular septation protein